MNAKEIFDKHLAPTSPQPVGLEIERAEGIYLYDKGFAVHEKHKEAFAFRGTRSRETAYSKDYDEL